MSMGDNEEILQQAADWRGAGKGVALATVVSTWGSSPRPAGAKLALEEGGGFIGSVSGGCVEGWHSSKRPLPPAAPDAPPCWRRTSRAVARAF